MTSLSSVCLYYTTFRGICQEVLEKFLKNFCGILRSTRTIFELTCTVSLPLDIYIISYLWENVNSQIVQTLQRKMMRDCASCTKRSATAARAPPNKKEGTNPSFSSKFATMSLSENPWQV